MFFCAELEGTGIELWVMEADGSVHVVKDIAVGAISSTPRDLVGYEGLLYFRADDGIHGEELWRSDGTEAGTHMVRDIVSVPQEALTVQSMVTGPDGLYLSAGLPATGTELWRFRTAEGKPMPVKDIAVRRLGSMAVRDGTVD
jgi:ELWxxDGT repeat protein